MRKFLCIVVVIFLLPIGSAHAVTGAHAIRSYPHRNAVKVNVLTQIGISYNVALDSSALESPNIIVSGSKNGVYSGSITRSVDSKTLIFKPTHPFLAGEIVSVNMRSLHSLSDGCWTTPEFFTFTTAVVAAPQRITNPEIPNQILSIPDTGTLPRVTVTKNVKPYPGQIYFANIFDPSGVGYRIRVNTDGTIAFAKRTQGFVTDYKANPNGTYSWVNSGAGHIYIADTSDKIIDSLSAANGFNVDGHEFRFSPEGNYVFIADDNAVTDMSQVIPGGNTSATIVYPVIQEFDKKHNLIFEWNTKDHFNIFDGNYQSFTSSYIDFCHMNSIDFDFDSNILVSNRNMNELTKIDRKTGDIIWRLGGNNNEFTFINDKYGFTGQHHFRRLPNGNYTTFDDGNFRPIPFQFSRALEYQIDQDNHIVTEVWEFRHTPDRFAGGMGSVQRLPNGNTAIGWGFADTVGYTEVDSLGNTVFELNFGTGTHSYRVYKFDDNYIRSGLGGLISAADHNFDSVAVGDTIKYTLKISNTGGATFTLKSFTPLTDTADFTMNGDTKLPIQIKPGESYSFSIFFHPQGLHPYADSITWTTDIIKNADLVIKDRTYLSGQGVVKLGVTESKNGAAFTISPNPASGNFIAISASSYPRMLSVTMYDILGKEIYNKDISGLSQFRIPIQDLAEGIYYVTLNSAKGSSVLRFARVK